MRSRRARWAALRAVGAVDEAFRFRGRAGRAVRRDLGRQTRWPRSLDCESSRFGRQGQLAAASCCAERRSAWLAPSGSVGQRLRRSRPPSGRTGRRPDAARRGRSCRASPRCRPGSAGSARAARLPITWRRCSRGEGAGAFLVRVVAAPHDAVDADRAERGPDVGRGRLAHAHVAALLEVLGGRARRHQLAVEAHLADRVAADVVHEAVEVARASRGSRRSRPR